MLRYTKQNNCQIAAILLILATVAYQAYGPPTQGLQVQNNQQMTLNFSWQKTPQKMKLVYTQIQAQKTNASNRPSQTRADELDRHKWRPENVLEVSGSEEGEEASEAPQYLESAYMYAINGEVDVQVTPHSKSYFSETSASVSITGTEMEEQTMDGKQALALYPSRLSRGFFIQQCSGYTGDIEVNYIGYKNQIMDKSEQWTQIDQYSGCEVSRVRGVQYLDIKIALDKTTAGTVKITEEKWLYTSDFKWFFRFIITMVVLTQLNAFFRTHKAQNIIRKLRGKAPLSEDDFAKLKDEESGQILSSANDDNYQQDKKEETRNYKQYKQLFYKWCVIAMHSLNAFTKILYLVFISKYSWCLFLSLWAAFTGPYVAIFTGGIKYGKNTAKESAVITGKYIFNLLDISQLKEQWKEKHEKLDKLVLNLPKLILVAFTFGYSLELFNNILIGQNWSWVQVISLFLTAYLLVSPFMKREPFNESKPDAAKTTPDPKKAAPAKPDPKAQAAAAKKPPAKPAAPAKNAAKPAAPAKAAPQPAKAEEDKEPGSNKITMKIMSYQNLYLLTVTLIVVFGVFHSNTEMSPEWAKDMPSIGMGHTWIY